MWDPVEGSEARNVRFVGYSDLDGRPDAIALMRHGNYLYVGHLWSGGVSIVDIRDPKNLKVVNHIPSLPNTWHTNLQVADDLLLCADEIVLFGTYPGTPMGMDNSKPWSSGLRIYDVSNPLKPEPLSFWPTVGRGSHRNWYTGGRYAYCSLQPEGYRWNIFVTLDLSDPRQPQEIGRWWLPGMWEAGGEQTTEQPGEWFWLHGPIVHGDRAYCGWWDAGMVILDISNLSKPKMLSRLDYSPPYGGATHTCLPLPGRGAVVIADESMADNCQEGQKLIWIVDVREETNPVPIATCPVPAERDFCMPGVRFGPHNLHENRPGSFQSDTLIFNAYFAAGLRIFDISNLHAPRDAGYFIPPPPKRMIDPRPSAARHCSSQDVYVDRDGLMYLTDYNCGLYVLEYTG